MSIAVRTNVTPLSILSALRQQVRGAAGDQVLYEVHTMEQLTRDSLARHRFLLLLFSLFAGLALLLACIGIYGVLAYLTGQRVAEMGIRIALGAKPSDLIWLVLRQSLGMIFLGVAIGAAAALGAAHLLENFVEGMQPATRLTFAIAIPALGHRRTSRELSASSPGEPSRSAGCAKISVTFLGEQNPTPAQKTGR